MVVEAEHCQQDEQERLFSIFSISLVPVRNLDRDIKSSFVPIVPSGTKARSLLSRKDNPGWEIGTKACSRPGQHPYFFIFELGGISAAAADPTATVSYSAMGIDGIVGIGSCFQRCIQMSSSMIFYQWHWPAALESSKQLGAVWLSIHF